MKTKVIY